MKNLASIVLLFSVNSAFSATLSPVVIECRDLANKNSLGEIAETDLYCPVEPRFLSFLPLGEPDLLSLKWTPTTRADVASAVSSPLLRNPAPTRRGNNNRTPSDVAASFSFSAYLEGRATTVVQHRSQPPTTLPPIPLPSPQTTLLTALLTIWSLAWIKNRLQST